MQPMCTSQVRYVYVDLNILRETSALDFMTQVHKTVLN